MSTSNEREDDIERLVHEGRVFRWTRRRAAWPGHATFVALKGGLVVLGDRYASEGIERTYTCDLASLLEGTFQDLIRAQLGAHVVAEVVTEVRREIGVAVPTGPEVARDARAAVFRVVSTAAPAPQPAAKPVTTTPAPAPQPPTKPATTTPVPAPQPPTKPAVTTSAPQPPTKPAVSTGDSQRVDVAVVSCARIGLPLLVSLRGVTRSPVKELLPRLQGLPFRVASGLSRDHAEALVARLTGLGAELQILPASA